MLCIYLKTLQNLRQVQVSYAQSKQDVCYIYTKTSVILYVWTGVIRD